MPCAGSDSFFFTAVLPLCAFWGHIYINFWQDIFDFCDMNLGNSIIEDYEIDFGVEICVIYYCPRASCAPLAVGTV